MYLQRYFEINMCDIEWNTVSGNVKMNEGLNGIGKITNNCGNRIALKLCTTCVFLQAGKYYIINILVL